MDDSIDQEVLQLLEEMDKEARQDEDVSNVLDLIVFEDAGYIALA